MFFLLAVAVIMHAGGNLSIIIIRGTLTLHLPRDAFIHRSRSLRPCNTLFQKVENHLAISYQDMETHFDLIMAFCTNCGEFSMVELQLVFAKLDEECKSGLSQARFCKEKTTCLAAPEMLWRAGVHDAYAWYACKLAR